MLIYHCYHTATQKTDLERKKEREIIYEEQKKLKIRRSKKLSRDALIRTKKRSQVQT